MPVSDSYLEFVLEQLGRVRPVTARRMFGGVGLYAGDRFFGLLDDDTLYFRTADANRADYVARGMPAFQPMGPGPKPMNYNAVPAEVLEQPDLLAGWMLRALAAAPAPKAKPVPARAPKPPGPGVSRRR
jgi:DNA transformation protein and related proteins